jgi:hypothetical protein
MSRRSESQESSFVVAAAATASSSCGSRTLVLRLRGWIGCVYILFLDPSATNSKW